MNKTTLAIAIAFVAVICLVGGMLACKARQIVRDENSRPTIEQQLDDINHGRVIRR